VQAAEGVRNAEGGRWRVRQAREHRIRGSSCAEGEETGEGGADPERSASHLRSAPSGAREVERGEARGDGFRPAERKGTPECRRNGLPGALNR
jgi:hypothetical protein